MNRFHLWNDGLRRALVVVGLMALAGCRQDMHDQPKYETLEGSSFFADGRASRPAVEGTVARGHLKLDDHHFRGVVEGKFATTFPAPVTTEILLKGRERFNIFCTPCHDQVGFGQGMVVLRGFPAPPSYHDERLREVPAGYMFDVITRGYGKMYAFGDVITPDERWAIVAYIRALQRSQNATLSDVPQEKRHLLDQPSD